MMVCDETGLVNAYSSREQWLERLHDRIRRLMRQRRKGWRRRLRRVYRRIYEVVCDIHVRTARDLERRYTDLLLPALPTQDMVRRTRPLARYTRRVMNDLAHGRFRRYIHGRMAVNPTFTVHECPEDYTSSTCGLCGCSTAVRGRTFRCAFCRAVFDRDVNGARNILLYHAVP